MKENMVEVKVGAFTLVALIATGLLMIQFSGFKMIVQPTYTINAEFANASGILKNSQVLLRGAKIGTVSEKPEIIDEGNAVKLKLDIRKDVKIPEGSKFKVGSYGLLGDRYVDVLPNTDEKEKFYTDGSTVEGDRSLELSELAGELAGKVEPVMQKLDMTIERINRQILSDENVENYRGSMENLHASLEKVDALLYDAQSGKGILHTVLKDKSAAADLKETLKEFKALSKNLRQHGVLFYKDRSDVEKK